MSATNSNGYLVETNGEEVFFNGTAIPIKGDFVGLTHLITGDLAVSSATVAADKFVVPNHDSQTYTVGDPGALPAGTTYHFAFGSNTTGQTIACSESEKIVNPFFGTHVTSVLFDGSAGSMVQLTNDGAMWRMFVSYYPQAGTP